MDSKRCFFIRTRKWLERTSINSCKGVFQNHQTVVEVNKTFITLIPKKEDVSFMKDFRLINLCNVVYKVITRLLSLRIRSYMTHLIEPCQPSFVPDQQSGDNIVVV